jgi:hypothetical protein
MPKASILKEWGGDLDFDMGAYVRWRAEAQILKSLLSFFFLYIFYTYIFVIWERIYGGERRHKFSKSAF